MREYKNGMLLFEDLMKWRTAMPKGALVCGIVEVKAGPGTAHLSVGTMGFTEVHMIAMADMLLERAAEVMLGRPWLKTEGLETLELVERARAELAFSKDREKAS